MANTILPSAQEYLESTTHINQATLVAREVPGEAGSYLYVTDYKRDITYQGNVYKAGKLKSVSNVTRTATLTANAVTIKTTGADETELVRALDSSSYLEKKIKIWRAVILEDGSLLPFYSDGSTFLLFEGNTTEVSLQETGTNTGQGTSIISWKCAGEFYELDRVNGRITDDASHRGIIVDSDGNRIPSNAAKRVEYQEDYGFFHANKSIDILATYQTQEKKYKIKKKSSWGGLKTDYKMVEYWETVTREVDIRFNLTAQYIPIVYGVRKVQGIPVFADTLANDPTKVYVVYTFCEGEIEGFLDFYLDDNSLVCYDSSDSEDRACLGLRRTVGDTVGLVAKVNGDGQNGATKHGEEYIYSDGSGDIRFWTYHGKPDQEASSVLVDIASREDFYGQGGSYGEAYGPEYWNSDFKLLDTAYVVMEVNITDERTSVPQLHADVRGKKVNTYNESGLIGSDETSLNPAWQKLDYLTSSTYGVGVSLDRIDLSSFIQAAALYDIPDSSYSSYWVPYWRYIGWNDYEPTNQSIMQTNVSLDTNNTLFKNVDSMLSQSISSLNIVNGKYTLTVEAESQTPIYIGDNDIVGGDVTVSDVTSKNKFNTVVASIEDPGLAWSTNAITFFEGDYLIEDSNIEKKMSLAFPYITNYYTARSLSERELRKSRFNREVKLTLPFYFIDLPINHPVRLTKSRYGWQDKEFLIREVSFLPTGNVSVTLREYTEGVFLNSQQADIGDEQVPIVVNLVKPPRDLEYVPEPVGTITSSIGKNGDLRWLPSLTPDVTHYTIRITGSVDPIVVPITSLNRAADFLSTALYGYAQGNYTIECRAVSGTRGLSSAPATISVSMNAAKNLPKVGNVTLVNNSGSNSFVWLGKEPIITWEKISDSYLGAGVATYLVDFIDPDTDDIISSYETSDTTIQLPYEENKEQYELNKSQVGIYRSLSVRVRGKGPNGELSVDWTYL